jgi:hypothetical protein
MYENVDKERLSLQVRKQSARSARTAPPAHAFRYSVEMASASSTGSTTTAGAISGKLDRVQLLKVAQVVYGQLAALESSDTK